MNPLDIAIKNTSDELKVPKELVENIYKAYWQSIRSYILTLPLKTSFTEEEFSKLKTSINIPSIGKLYTNLDIIDGVKRRYNYLHKIRQNNDKNKET